MKNHLKSLKGFTLIEVSMAIALVAIGLTVGVLGYNGYQAWASSTAKKENALALMSSVAQYKAISNQAVNATAFVAGPVTRTRAQNIYDQIADTAQTVPGVVNNGLPIGVQIVPLNFELPATAEFPSNWNESAAGIFAPIPTN